LCEQFLRYYGSAVLEESSFHTLRLADFAQCDDGRIVALSLNMDAEIKEEFAAVRVDIRNVETALRLEIRGVETALRQEVREEAIATRRHFDMVAESLRDDIRIIAEGLIALDAKVETMRDSG
jgi:hypothetical protein